jgi:hypothetical protein
MFYPGVNRSRRRGAKLLPVAGRSKAAVGEARHLEVPKIE